MLQFYGRLEHKFPSLVRPGIDEPVNIAGFLGKDDKRE
jgi:hypothetical protein